MTELTLQLPLAPSVNHYWRAYAGRVILSKDGRRYRDNAVADIWQSIGKPRTMTGRLAVSIVVNPRNRRVIDIDNRLKAALDVLTYAKVYQDDSQIDRLTIERGEIVKGGAMTISIRQLR